MLGADKNKFDDFFIADTGYFQSTQNQPSPACSMQHSDNDDLYQQIMQEVMNAHAHESSLTADPEYGLTNDDNNGKDSPPNRTHRRSYMLAIRQESSRG